MTICPQGNNALKRFWHFLEMQTQPWIYVFGCGQEACVFKKKLMERIGRLLPDHQV